MQLLFATNNANKLHEVRSILGSDYYKIVGLKDLNIYCDIPENEPTIEGNAKQKVDFVKENYNLDCFADDTGLIVEALDGAPGVHSARYAGPEADSKKNINKLLDALDNTSQRSAFFKTCIALNLHDQQYLFKGICKGQITKEKRGKGGFGYDPIFIPDGYDITFSEMSIHQKNKISHRAKAISAFIDFLNSMKFRP